jgi:hypothetical protein
VKKVHLGEILGSHGGELKMTVFWVVAPCSLVEVYGRFRGAWAMRSSPW